jgi:hypothetical protein
MNYIKNNNQGIIALTKINEQYEYSAIDSSYCVLEEYSKEIESGEYFDWIKESKLDFNLMVSDFKEVRSTQNQKLIDDYLVWERPNIYIDFESKYLVNYYLDRLFETMVPSDWKSKYVKNIEEFLTHIPKKMWYWE